MTGPTRPTRGEELLLAKISAAAGRAYLGKRRATYTAVGYTAPAHAVPVRGIGSLLAFVLYGRPSAPQTRRDARLDLYEHGMTVALKGRIHVVRYDATSVFEEGVAEPYDPARAGTTCTISDADGRRITLHAGPERGGAEDAEEWWPGIRRAVTRARLPRALAALAGGERLTFGDIWLTGEGVGSGRVSARWPQVQQAGIRKGAVGLDIAGTWHRLGPAASEVPNLFVFCALVERLRTDGIR
ncbi:DUF6585 family protein [Streptomyces cinnamoneus]|uniref:Uncharacterized protein n=1 Tax=Streptomyces cinnamoneus TaxID=53446 RepID=A0A918WEG8_STRCJ|nr:DUF6585 family protein [Streptomyces cinnamoneus]GHC32086.1 hypothetical protein GCM10010507_00290 [Streptomyces cinnamoneus]